MISRPVLDSTGRVLLPAVFIEANSIRYGQPITLTISGEGTQQTFLCAASFSTSGSTDFQFDRSLLCKPAPATSASVAQQQQLVASVTPIPTKVLTAASIKVAVPDQLLRSAVPAAKLQQRLVQKGCTLYLSSGVYCQVLDISPAAVQGTVYRVVPSTAVQLTALSQLGNVSSDSAEHATGAAAAGHSGSASTTPAAASKSSGSSSSSRPRSSKAGSSISSSTSKTAATSSQDLDRKSASKPSSSSISRIKANRSSKQEEAVDDEEVPTAAAGSGSMFDLLNALGDD